LDEDGDTYNGWSNEDFELKQCINYNFQYSDTVPSNNRSAENIWSCFPSFIKQAFVNVFKNEVKLSPQAWIVYFERYSKLLDTRLKKVDEGCNDIEPEFYMVYEDVDFPLNEEYENCGFNMAQAVQRCVEDCGDSSLFSSVQKVVERLKKDSSCVVDDYRFSLVYNIGVLKKVKLEVV
jgi:hypothetical protein